MKIYEKKDLQFLVKDDELYVVADSWFNQVGYNKSNKSRWYQLNIKEKYNRGKDFFHDKELGLCVQCEVMEEVSSNLWYRQNVGNALADLISIEHHNFTNQNWKETSTKESSEQLYQETIQPKISAALEDIKPKLIGIADFELFTLPDELLINGKKYISEEVVQRDYISASMKLESLKSMILS